ncbi:MAG: S8 family serine peptidase [Sedimentisphaerales bacterium]
MINRKILIGLVALLAANSLLLADQPAYKPGVILVRFANDPNTSAKNTILKSVLGTTGSPVKSEYTLVHGLTLVSLPAGVSVENAMASLKQSSSVMYAGPDYVSHIFVVPNDTMFSNLWGMHNTGQAGGTSGADIDAPGAWDISTGNGNIIVAVTDTGVDYNHPDLTANMWTNANGFHGHDFVNDDNDPMDDEGHGTHVSGTIGAVGNNGLGVAGVCWHVKIMAVKILDANGSGSLSDSISGIQYAVSNGAKVINASWGYSPGVPVSYLQPLYDAIAAARDANVIFVAAAGNSGNNNDASPVYPASFDLGNVISVMATTNTDAQAYYSNYGLMTVDLGAPGGGGLGGTGDILSTYPGGGYMYMAGTSMASPHVAGACALLLSIDSTLTASQVKQILLNTVDKTLPGLCVSGGRLNLAAAAQEAQHDTTPPTPSTAGWLTPPVATGLHTIAMEALNEIDRSNVEYYFECVNDANINSGWEPNTLYVFKDPAESKIKHGKTYGFRVKARDKSTNHNETAWSNTMYATTAAVTDNLPPAPSPAQWAIQPILIRPSPLVLRMKIKGKGTDENGELFKYQYYDTLTPGTVIDSGWKNSADGTMPDITSGITLNHTYVFNCKVKDNLGNETGWSQPDVYVTLTTATGPRILHVPSQYLTIQSAIDAANTGDIVEVSPYPVPPYYYQGINFRGLSGNINLRFHGKAITVRSTNPENPDVVAATIIDCNGAIDPTGPRRAFIFDNGEGPSSILAGFTIRNAYVKAHQGRNGDANLPDINALPGYTAAGAAILCGPNPDPCFVLGIPDNWGTGTGSPTIRNCVFINCIVEGGNGGLGADGNDGNDFQAADPCATPPAPSKPATPGQSGGNGGDSGSALGGAIYCSSGSNPVIKNCTITGGSALSGLPGNGGNGGNGGNDPNLGPAAGGNAGRGADVNFVAGGGICAVLGSNPTIIGCIINNCNAHVVTSYGSPGSPGTGNPSGQPAYGGNFGQAYGGGVYDAVGSAAVNISSTTFTQNRSQEDTEGGIYKDGYGGGICLDVYGTATTTMADCNFTGNSSDTVGGGIVYGGAGGLVLQNCKLTGNTTVVDGGGMAGFFGGTGTFEAYNSNITGNTAGAGTNAGYGGGFYLDTTIATIDDCNFSENQAQEGGAIAGVNLQVDIRGTDITSNSAVAPSGIGGGLALWNTTGEVADCTLKSNSAAENGGAVFSEGWVTLPLDFSNCLITDNTANFEGGGLSNNSGAWMQLHNCTIAYNSATDSVHSAGGGVSDAEYFAWVEIEDSILWGNSALSGRQIAVGSIFGSSPDPGGPFADVDVSYSDVEGGEGQVYIEPGAYAAVWWMYGSFDADPLFAETSVSERTYYLSQMPAGQLTNSPCVDAGDILASDLESDVDPTLNTRLTTRTDLVEDTGTVDLGYHYKTGTPTQYQLTTGVYNIGHGQNGRLNAQSDGDNPFDINDPNTQSVNQGTEVILTAIPEPNYKVWYWSGTDDDTSTSPTNTVLMNSDKKVVVAFQPKGMYYYLTVTIIGQGSVIIDPNKPLYNFNEVVNLTAVPANPSNAVSWTGTDDDYSEAKTNTVTMTTHKTVTVRFYAPRILYVGGNANYPIIQQAVNDANDGDIVMLTPGTYVLAEPPPSGTTSAGYTVGYDWPYLLINKDITLTSTTPENPAATSIIARIDVWNVSRHCIIQGITIRDTTYWGTDLFDPNGNWKVTTPTTPGTDGQPGPETPGAGITLNGRASPTVRYCVFSNCIARGIHGADGSAGVIPGNIYSGSGGPGGMALGGGAYCGPSSNPLFENCLFTRCIARGGDGGNGAAGSTTNYPGHGGGWGDKNAPWWQYQRLDYWKYSGYGGAVFCDDGSTAEFNDCSFSNNIAIGGSCGISGNNPFVPGWPYSHYKIQSFGGAIYASSGSAPTFTGCSFINNTADINGSPTYTSGGVTVAAYPTLSYGGAVAFENGAAPLFTNCSFQQNLATVGGAMYQDEAFPEIIGSDFIDNSALYGGAILFSQGISEIRECNFIGNVATFETAQGGAITALGANIEVVDSNIANNHSTGSGGGIYLSSKNIDGNEFEGGNSILIKNCLITGNIADLDGGGISASWYCDTNVVNCTIFNNRVSGLGGGLFSSYGSYVNILNSIIWGNQAGIGSSGSQIAVSGIEPPAGMQVLYSDVQDSNDPCAWSNNINALDFVICFDTTGSMGGDIDAIKTAARQITNAIAAQYADYRLALVDFRDYPDGNHGSPGDWAYRDRVKFTTDANILISGLQPMAAGGGADTPEAIYTALMHSIDANALVARLTANGYANYIDPNSPGLGDWRQGNKVMRVILVLSDAPPHDPEPYTNYVLNDIITAANSENLIHIIPVVIRGDPDAENAMRPVAVGTGGTLILATDSNTVRDAVLGAIGLLSQIPAPIFIGPNNTINWDPSTFTWWPDSHNINADPLFIGGFFLSQIDAGQLINSPCADAGSDNVDSPDINLSGYTTRVDSVPDVCTVDMGYHYPPFVPVQYQLGINATGPTIISPVSNPSNWFWFTTVHLEVSTPPTGYEILWSGTDDDTLTGTENTVLMNTNKTVTVTFVRNTCDLTVISNSGGTVTPASGIYSRGTAVTLTATPAAGYRIESWNGTDNDGLFTRTNTVTMSGDKTVRVTFSLPQTRTVPGDFTTIQAAVSAARSGDVVSVASGVYRGNQITINKEITIVSTNPDDPCVVAATIIDSTGFANQAIEFDSGADSNTVLDGFTITGGTWYRVASQDATVAGQNGPDGGGLAGGAVYINSGASPTIKNCVIRDTTITGGNAGSGGNADATNPAGRGGWAGWARGGGIYIAPFANPTLINCTITNCTVVGGNAGNGGNSSGSDYRAADYEDANYGGSYSNPYQNGFIPPQPWWALTNSDGQQYIGDYRFYSGYGGGVFCDANSEANFIDCDITNNTARGGMSGVGGTRPQGIVSADPVTAYRIPSYGGGVYCSANADINFVGCIISGNVAPRPDATYHTDPYLGHGGGIAFEDTASIQLQNCTISDNNSAVGGGVFWSGGEPQVLDCDIMRNTAYLGGGIYAMESAGQIRGCTLRNNFAGVSPNDVDVIAGQGGGIFGSSIDSVIADCFLTNNTSSTSGGGIYFYGVSDANTIIRNCLLTGNQAGRDGGGISTNWGAVVSVENCTLYNNQATGAFGVSGNTGFGGGLYCSYGAQTDVKNSIFWDNNDVGLLGNEIAEGIGFVESGTTGEYYYCGTVSVSYSDIEGGQTGVLVSDGCPLIWGLGNRNVDPLFVNAVGGDFHLQQITAGQMVDSPCINVGGDLAVSLGMFRYSTSTLGTSDTGIVDLGYHYPISDYCRKWDLYVDNLIDFRDFAVFASTWVDDLGGVGYGIDDLKEFTYCWLEELGEDVNAPTPNPMTWAIPPRALTGSSVTMTASTAVDASGQVYYQFEDVNGTPTAWQVDPCYIATGLSPTGEYCFRVRARDKYNNKTAWSEAACVSNIGDVNAPTPAPIFVAVAAQNIARTDPNTASGQFEWDPTTYQWDWWHRVIVDVTGVTDNITPTSELEVRFICSNSSYSSDNVIPATYRPILIGHPVAIGGRVVSGGSVVSGSYRLTWNGTNQIVYEVYVDAVGGSYGRQLSWHVCVYDASQNAACTGTHSIPQ